VLLFARQSKQHQAASSQQQAARTAGLQLRMALLWHFLACASLPCLAWLSSLSLIVLAHFAVFQFRLARRPLATKQ
jgi:hypothetical protein